VRRSYWTSFFEDFLGVILADQCGATVFQMAIMANEAIMRPNPRVRDAVTDEMEIASETSTLLARGLCLGLRKSTNAALWPGFHPSHMIALSTK